MIKYNILSYLFSTRVAKVLFTRFNFLYIIWQSSYFKSCGYGTFIYSTLYLSLVKNIII